MTTRLITTFTLMLALLVGGLAVPVNAHSGYYCGHTSTSHWTWHSGKHTVRYNGWHTWNGDHYHEVTVTDVWGSYGNFYRC